MNGQAQASQALLDGRFPGPQGGFVIRKKGEIIHIAQVPFAVQLPLDKVIEGVEIAIGPKLAGQVADGQPAWAVGGKQIIAGEKDHLVDLAVDVHAALQDAVNQPEHVGVLNFACQFKAQDGMIDSREELLDVALQNVPIPAGKRLAAIQRSVGALAHPVGVAVMDETALESGSIRLQRA